MHRMDGCYYSRQQGMVTLEIVQLLMEKGANIEATNKVHLVANVY